MAADVVWGDSRAHQVRLDVVQAVDWLRLVGVREGR